MFGDGNVPYANSSSAVPHIQDDIDMLKADSSPRMRAQRLNLVHVSYMSWCCIRCCMFEETNDFVMLTCIEFSALIKYCWLGNSFFFRRNGMH